MVVAPGTKVTVIAPTKPAKQAATAASGASAPGAAASPSRFIPSSSREERSRCFGIDCPDSVVFREWSVGGEYIRKLLLKNTHDKLQVVHYRQPRQKATFFVDFPEPVTLSSGMSFELVIRFRPTAVQEIHDSIPLHVEGRGDFQVGLVALTPYARLSVPDKHDFEFCPVKATSTATVSVSNSGTVPLSITWEVPAPFQIEPKLTKLDLGEKHDLQLSFAPSEACSLVARAVAKQANGDVLASFPVSGIAKYVFLKLSLEKPVLDFGSVLNGTVVTKTFVVQNISCVHAQYVIHKVDRDIVSPFAVTPMSGQISRDGSQTIAVRFVPESTSAHYSTTFRISCVGGNSLTVRCCATVEGPKIALSVKSLDFGDVDLDALANSVAAASAVAPRGRPAASPIQASGAAAHEKIIVLKNLTNTEAPFNVIGCEPGQAFRITPYSGVLGPGKLANLRVSFRPTMAINYLRRVYIVVHHGDEALYLDLLGTAYNSKTRPAPFGLRHVHAYQRRLAGGLGRMTPDDISGMMEAIEAGTAPADEEEAAARATLQASMQDLVLDSPDAPTAPKSRNSPAASSHKAGKAKSITSIVPRSEPLSHVLPSEERYRLPFSLDENQVVFRHGAFNESRLVTVRNHTSAKASASWSVESSSAAGSGSAGAPLWTVEPASGDIPPFGTATFEVRLNGPPRAGATFGDYLECYVSYKQMRSFRLVSEATFTPPQCLLLLCQHVATVTEASAPPAVHLPSHVAFPSCHKLDSVFQVLALTNKGETVVSYSMQITAKRLKAGRQGARSVPPGTVLSDLDDEDGSEEGGAHEDSPGSEDRSRGVFGCFPSHGTVAPGATSLVLCSFCPNAAAKFAGVAVISFNESSIGARQVFLRGEGFLPQLALAGNGVVMFRPTAVGAKTSRLYVVENPSRIPIRFRVTVPPKYHDVLTIEPSSGVLDACEQLSLQATFAPQTVRRYEVKIPVAVTAVRTPLGCAPVELEQSLYAIGDGLIGLVSIEPLDVNFGTVLVGAESSQQVTLFNSSLCDLAYRLRYRLTKGDAESAANVVFTPSPTGYVRARSHVTVEVRVTLPHRGTFEYLVYVVADASPESLRDEALDPDPSLEDIRRLAHCTVSITGGHPVLEITDVRSVFQRKSHLWRQMSISNVNAALTLPVTERDTETASYTFEGASQNLTPIVCDLGVDVYRTAPTKVLVRLDNTGHCPVSFRFWLPHEGDVPKEPWHQDPVQGPEDLELAEVIDRQLFDISPSRATVNPGEHVVLLVTYQHTKIGKHTLPVLLRIDRGKRVFIHFTGRTLKEGDRYLAFHHTLSHQLMPVAIGDMDPPLQYTELQNLSHQVAEYCIDMSALRDAREKNFDFPVFQCLNPRGTIPAMSTLLLSWYFRPLEAKHYDVKLPIHVEGGDVYTITVSGQGYHPNRTSKAEIQNMHSAHMAPLPKAPTLKHPLLPLRLSLDVLRFGVAPVHTLHRHIVYLHNDHPSDAFLFEWQCALQYGDQLLDVDPPRGRIAPGEARPMRVTLYTGSTSHIIDHPIHCHVLNDDLRQRRLAKRRAREQEASMQLEAGPTNGAPSGDGESSKTFSLTGGSQARDAARAARKSGATLATNSAASSRHPVTAIPPKYQNTTRLRQAIQQLTEAAAAETVNDDDESLVDSEVLPTVLEVLVQTRIVQLDAYYEAYGRDLGPTQLYYPTFNAFAAEVPADVQDAMLPLTQDDMDAAGDVIEELLLQLVHSKRIRDAYSDISDDPVPYFCEMRLCRPEDEAAEADVLAEQQPTRAADAVGSSSASEVSATDPLRMVPVTGDLQCLVEEVVESLLFGITTEAQQPSGVLSKAIDAAARARTTSQSGQRPAAR